MVAEWSTLATPDPELSPCCVAIDGSIYLGTDDARGVRVEADGRLEQLRGFEAIAGRDRGTRARR